MIDNKVFKYTSLCKSVCIMYICINILCIALKIVAQITLNALHAISRIELE